jgi:hypothetical protein
MPRAHMSDARQALEALIDETLAGPAASLGYARGDITFARSIDIVLHKDAATFVVWLKPAAEDTGSYRETAYFKVGHRGDPPDRQGYALIDAFAERLRRWEASLGADDAAQMFAPAQASGAADAEWLPYFEWLAVRSGLKPSSRHVAPAAVAAQLLTEAHANGLRAVAHPAGEFVTGF